MPDLRGLLLAWAGLAIVVAAGLWLLGKAYQRGFADGRQVEREEVKAAKGFSSAEVDKWWNDLPGGYRIENNRLTGVSNTIGPPRCPACGQWHGTTVSGTVPHG